MDTKLKTILSALMLASVSLHAAKPEPIQNIRTDSSPVFKDFTADKAVDGIVSDKSRWIGEPDENGRTWIELSWDQVQEIQGIHMMSGYGNGDPVESFSVDFKDATGQWVSIPSATIERNKETALTLRFDTTVDVVTNSLRIDVLKTPGDKARIKEIKVWPDAGAKMPDAAQASAIASNPTQSDVPLIYLNQTGFSVGKPKRFTAPTLEDGTPFAIHRVEDGSVLYEGSISGHIGDFSDFEPATEAEFYVEAGGHRSVPFVIEPWLHERVTYQRSIDFMIDSRHYHGTSPAPARSSYAWRDDHMFAWVLRALVPQYLANPAAYQAMPQQMHYTQPQDGRWGALEPYDEAAPDIVKLIHWGADVTVTQQLTHEFFKGDLAYFLYAWPTLEPWLPQQNYDAVLAFVTETWAQERAGKYPYSISEDHNMFSLKTVVGSNKGEYPPAHSLLPNTLMSVVAQREGLPNADKYLQAAYKQAEWVVNELDWEDPLTTKGQRLSEHITITGLTAFYQIYPDKSPRGIKAKLNQWADIVIRRSANLWDFRKLTEDGDWTPSGEKRTMWNEPGNVMGFPACVLSVLPFIEDPAEQQRLEEIVWSHIDNQWGRNPTGRHFSYDAPREIEGVEHGWYSYNKGGIGQLAEARFVFDGAPKHVHYPYNPDAENYGWTEGWVNFNSAFNLSLGYLARQDIQIQTAQQPGFLTIRLFAPINWDPQINPSVEVIVSGNKSVRVSLNRESLENQSYTGAVKLSDLAVSQGNEIGVSYGFGYMQTEVTTVIK